MSSINETVTHLRTVHFSLLVVCFALYGISVGGKSREFDKALDQLAEIEVVLSRWEPRWLELSANALVEKQE